MKLKEVFRQATPRRLQLLEKLTDEGPKTAEELSVECKMTVGSMRNLLTILGAAGMVRHREEEQAEARPGRRKRTWAADEKAARWVRLTREVFR